MLRIFIGMAALLLGLLIYVLGRPLNSVYLGNQHLNFFHNSNFHSLCRSIANYIPDLLHPFAFAIITSTVLSSKSKHGNLVICSSWCLIDCGFEFGQYYKMQYSRMIPDWFNNIPLLNTFKPYFLKGTFDILDMLLFIVGSGLAYLLLETHFKEDHVQ
jgi:hypothetical protein